MRDLASQRRLRSQALFKTRSAPIEPANELPGWVRSIPVPIASRPRTHRDPGRDLSACVAPNQRDVSPAVMALLPWTARASELAAGFVLIGINRCVGKRSPWRLVARPADHAVRL